MPNKTLSSSILLVIITLICSHNTLASEFDCGPISNPDNIGPWDYFDPANHRPTTGVPQGNIKLVTNSHLGPGMNSLENGNSGVGIKGFLADIDYTFRRIPNHPRALDMISRFQIRHGGKIPPIKQWGASWKRSAECYFDRALRLTPNNPVVHMLFGIHFHRNGKLQDAEKEYKISEAFQPNSVELQYNMGLLYFELKKYDLSAGYAKKAYHGGHPLPGLRDKLINVGKWPESDNSQ